MESEEKRETLSDRILDKVFYPLEVFVRGAVNTCSTFLDIVDICCYEGEMNRLAEKLNRFMHCYS